MWGVCRAFRRALLVDEKSPPRREIAYREAMTGAWHKSYRSEPRRAAPRSFSVRPQLAVNIGMCARAMANFGLSDLRLVNPREGWPRTGALRKGAYAAAAGAVHLLESARLFPSLEGAVADLNGVFATTAREREPGQAGPRRGRSDDRSRRRAFPAAEEGLASFSAPSGPGSPMKRLRWPTRSSAFRSIQLTLRSISRRLSCLSATNG